FICFPQPFNHQVARKVIILTSKAGEYCSQHAVKVDMMATVIMEKTGIIERGGLENRGEGIPPRIHIPLYLIIQSVTE
ncbi:hypothetical protein, partial [Yersinia pestis]|uniref:hypothetical protein n=1 Tax=Yersinia pestis TaxID=632 RepID=UPI001AA18C34